MRDDRLGPNTFLMLACDARETTELTRLADRLCSLGTVHVQRLPPRRKLECAIEAFASVRGACADVTLIGMGTGCAAAVMIAGAYPVRCVSLVMPEFDMRLRYGALGTPAKRRLFGVVAPMLVFTAKSATATLDRDVRTVLRGASSRSLELITLEGTAAQAFEGKNLDAVYSKIVDGLALIMTQYRLSSDTICV